MRFKAIAISRRGYSVGYPALMYAKQNAHQDAFRRIKHAF